MAASVGLKPARDRRMRSTTPLGSSTVGAAVLDALAGVEGLVGWHNFYPRPGTGLDGGYYARQSRLFTSRGLRLLAFVPGEVTRRAPLYRGLPTLEEHRHRDAYTSAVRLRALADGVEAVCAEGVVAPHHLEWIRRAEDGVLTLPVNLAPGCAWLEGDWRLRVEETGRSHRLEGTRGRALSGVCANADAMETGSLQIDTLGRYRGEVHLMTATAPLDGEHVRLGEVAAPYRCLVGLLRGGQQVRLVRADRPAAGALIRAPPVGGYRPDEIRICSAPRPGSGPGPAPRSPPGPARGGSTGGRGARARRPQKSQSSSWVASAVPMT